MAVHRFFVPPKQIVDGNVFIRGTDVWHITKVLRLSTGDEVTVFDGVGHEYRVVIGKIKPREILGTALERWTYRTESALHLTIAQSVPKVDKMDVIVQKAVEVGANVIIPLKTERSILNTKHQQLQGETAAKRLDRWSRIGIEAAKQSCRTAVPKIETILTVEEFLAQSLAADLRIVLWEEEAQNQLRQVLRAQSTPVRSAIIVVGPEGGLTPEEVEQFHAHGYLSVSLGKRILRTETAGMIVLGILQYEFGDY